MKKTNYGNWVPANMMKMLYGSDAAVLGAGLGAAKLFHSRKPGLAVGLVLLPMLGMTAYMQRCRNEFSFTKGGLMGRIHQNVADHLEWDGRGELLDIGCGAGALGIRCIKAHPRAKLTGMDYWGAEWSYAQSQCEWNAEVEGVADRCRFLKGDAAHLDFEDGSFDAVVSNFVFHEVKSEPDKHALILEALRVLKKGGSFALQDMMSQKKLYGDMDKFCKRLLRDGVVSEIHFLPHTENADYIPDFIKTPWMLSGMGMIYGKK